MTARRLTVTLSFALAALGLVSTAAAQATSEPSLPETLSPEMRAALSQPPAPPAGPLSLAQIRGFIDAAQVHIGALQQKRYAVTVSQKTIRGVPVREIAPLHPTSAKAVLMNLHGGGFQLDSGSLTENIPLAALTGVKVVAVLYRLAPEHPFPAAVDDALAVYRGLLKDYAPAQIGVYGTSAGAVLTPELMVRLRAEGLPLPAAIGVFSGAGDLAHLGDSAKRFPLPPPSDFDTVQRAYLAGHDAADPAVSPLKGDLKAFPPTYCIASTRDVLMSATTDLCRALDRDGVRTRMTLFDGLPHAFWAYLPAPESDEAFADMAAFFRAELRAPPPEGGGRVGKRP